MRFESIKEIRAESKKVLMAIPERDYLACFEDWKIRWHKCISSRGDYFEGDEIYLQEQIKIFHFTNKFTLLFAHSSTLNNLSPLVSQ